jgi:hypothetical protein
MLLSDHPFVKFLILSAFTFIRQGDCSAAFFTPIPAEAAVVDDKPGSRLVRLECGKGIRCNALIDNQFFIRTYEIHY